MQIINIPTAWKRRRRNGQDFRSEEIAMNSPIKTRLAILLSVLLTLGAAFGCAKQPASSQSEPSTPDIERVYMPAAEALAGGSGTAEDPYQIGTAGQLALLSELVAKDSKDRESYRRSSYILTADIELQPCDGYLSWGTTAPAYE